MARAPGHILAGCAAALMAASSACADVKTSAPPASSQNCQAAAGAATDSPIKVGDDGKTETSDAHVCTDGGNSVASAFNTSGANAAGEHTILNINAGMGRASAPGGTAEGAAGTPQRAAILSRSWRQIFPRAN